MSVQDILGLIATVCLGLAQNTLLPPPRQYHGSLPYGTVLRAVGINALALSAPVSSHTLKRCHEQLVLTS